MANSSKTAASRRRLCRAETRTTKSLPNSSTRSVRRPCSTRLQATPTSWADARADDLIFSPTFPPASLFLANGWKGSQSSFDGYYPRYFFSKPSRASAARFQVKNHPIHRHLYEPPPLGRHVLSSWDGRAISSPLGNSALLAMPSFDGWGWQTSSPFGRPPTHTSTYSHTALTLRRS